MGNTQRLFFALWPNDAVRSRIEELLNHVVLPVGARKVPPANLHLTAVFIGPVDIATRACVERAAAEVRGDSFTLRLTHIGHWRQPRVVWLAPMHTPPALSHLVRNLESALAACRFTPEARAYCPHITLARKVNDYPAEQTAAALDWNVESFSLVESRSETRRVSYHVLNTWALHGTSPAPNQG